jgi:hypothetical protein
LKLLLERDVIMAGLVVIATVLTTATSFITSTTLTEAYAQPAQQSSPCPSGFELNPGVCQAEPTLACDEDAGFQLTEHPNLGLVCYKAETAEPRCVDVFGNVGGYDPFRGLCLTALGNPSNVNPDCNYLEGQGWRFGGLEGMNTFMCVRELFDEPTPECDPGELNEESGLCEVRLGRNNNNNSA